MEVLVLVLMCLPFNLIHLLAYFSNCLVKEDSLHLVGSYFSFAQQCDLLTLVDALVWRGVSETLHNWVASFVYIYLLLVFSCFDL